MARPVRLHVPDGWYHGMSRGNGGEALFRWSGTAGGSLVWWPSCRNALIREERGLDAVARYIHLNPIRIGGFQTGTGTELCRGGTGHPTILASGRGSSGTGAVRPRLAREMSIINV